MLSIKDLKKSILDDLQAGMTYQKIGDKYNVNKAVIWRIANNAYEPKSSRIRKALGLAEIVEVESYQDDNGNTWIRLK